MAGGLKNSASLQELSTVCREVTGNRIAIDSIPENRTNDLRLFVADCSKLDARFASADPCQSRFAKLPNRSVQMIVADTHNWIRENEQSLANL